MVIEKKKNEIIESIENRLYKIESNDQYHLENIEKLGELIKLQVEKILDLSRKVSKIEEIIKYMIEKETLEKEILALKNKEQEKKEQEKKEQEKKEQVVCKFESDYKSRIENLKEIRTQNTKKSLAFLALNIVLLIVNITMYYY